MSYLDGELLLLASEPGPNVCLHLAWGSLLEQPYQQGIAGRPCQVLAQLRKQCRNVIVDAHHVLLALCFLSKGGDYDDPHEPVHSITQSDISRWGVHWR